MKIATTACVPFRGHCLSVTSPTLRVNETAAVTRLSARKGRDRRYELAVGMTGYVQRLGRHLDIEA